MPSSAVWPTTAVFQSMLSKRRATSMRIDWCTESGFQSTLSKRRATLHRRRTIRKMINFNPRSPSGERRFKRLNFKESYLYFNPRSPSGERPCRIAILKANNLFQSTLSKRRATLQLQHHLKRLIKISIHALQAESDICK